MGDSRSKFALMLVGAAILLIFGGASFNVIDGDYVEGAIFLLKVDEVVAWDDVQVTVVVLAF